MGKIQNLNNPDQNAAIFFIGAAVIIVIAFLLFTPKIAATLFPFKRQAVYKDFIKEVEKDKKINPQHYWEFREFYSPGYFTLSRDGLNKTEVENVKKMIGVDITPGTISLPFAIFHSPKLISLDSLSTKKDIGGVLLDANPKNIIIKNSNTLIYKDGKKKIKIVFILPESEMKKAVGFFDFNGEDKKITENKYWLNITSVTLD